MARQIIDGEPSRESLKARAYDKAMANIMQGAQRLGSAVQTGRDRQQSSRDKAFDQMLGLSKQGTQITPGLQQEMYKAAGYDPSKKYGLDAFGGDDGSGEAEGSSLVDLMNQNAQSVQSARTRKTRREDEKFDLDKRYMESKIRGGGSPSTEATKAFDRESGKELAKYTVGGGRANVSKNLQRLEGAIERLSEKDEISGGITTAIPLLGSETAQDFINPKMAAIRDDVRAAIQGSLKAILGGQFTEKEAEQMFARAINPRLSDDENIRRVGIELSALKEMETNKEEAVRYFSRNKTLVGFNPSRLAPDQTETTTEQSYANLEPVGEGDYAPTQGQDFFSADAMADENIILTPERTQQRQTMLQQLRAKKAQAAQGEGAVPGMGSNQKQVVAQTQTDFQNVQSQIQDLYAQRKELARSGERDSIVQINNKIQELRDQERTLSIRLNAMVK